jgi:hypothetical protein
MHDTSDNIVRCIRLEYWLQYPIEPHLEYVQLITFLINNVSQPHHIITVILPEPLLLRLCI